MNKENIENNVDEIENEELKKDRRRLIIIGIIIGLTTAFSAKELYNEHKYSIGIQKDLEDIYNFFSDDIEHNYIKTYKKLVK